MDCLSLLSSLLLAWFTVHFLLSQLRSTQSRGHANKQPPGPFPLPIIGNLLSVGNKPHKSMAKLAKTYGPIMTLQLGQVTAVIISSAAVAREVLQRQDLPFSSRAVIDAVCALNHHQVSMVWLPVSDPWRKLRKICNSRVFSGSRLDASQQIRQNKVEELVSYVQRNCQAGVAVDIGQVAFDTTLNLLSNTFFPVDLIELGGEHAREFKELVLEIMDEAGKPNFADFFPLLKRIDPQGIRRRMGVYFKKMVNLFDNMIDQRLEARRLGLVKTNDVLDVLLSVNQDNSEELERSEILHLLLDSFVAGTDTTSSTLEWAMAELLHNPAMLKKAQAELKNVIGKGPLFEEGKVARLPYLQAIVKETLRSHPPGPFLIPRKVYADVELCGFTVPKYAHVLVNAWAIGRDPRFWENPNSFEPERFLKMEVDVKGRDFELIPFGAGRRICPGLPLAMRMLHLMLGSLICSFDWKLEEENMNMDDKFGITTQKAHPLCAIPTQRGSTAA